MKKIGLILATMLVMLCVLGSMSPASGNNQVPAPKISLEINEVPVRTLNIPVCSKFTLEIWIRDIPADYYMVGFDVQVAWDTMYMEPVDWPSIYDHGWGPYSLSVGESGFTLSFLPSTKHAIISDSMWATITLHCLDEGVSDVVLSSLGDTVWLWDGFTTPFPTPLPDPFVTTVHQLKAVGGVLTPTNKLEVLAPYLALIGLVGAVTVAVAATKRRRKP